MGLEAWGRGGARGRRGTCRQSRALRPDNPARRGELGETLRALAASGRTLVVTTHDDDFARDFADRTVILAEGLVVEAGDPRQVLTNPQHPATQALLQQTKDRRT